MNATLDPSTLWACRSLHSVREEQGEGEWLDCSIAEGGRGVLAEEMQNSTGFAKSYICNKKSYICRFTAPEGTLVCSQLPAVGRGQSATQPCPECHSGCAVECDADATSVQAGERVDYTAAVVPRP